MKKKLLILTSLFILGCTNSNNKKEITFENNDVYKETTFVKTCTKQTSNDSNVSITYETDDYSQILGVKTITTVNLKDYPEEKKEEFINTINGYYSGLHEDFISYTSNLEDNIFTYTLYIDAHKFTLEDWRKIGLEDEFFQDTGHSDFWFLINHVQNDGFACD